MIAGTPIAQGDPVAFGGRVLPGSTDPAKYKNSSETQIYADARAASGVARNHDVDELAQELAR